MLVLTRRRGEALVLGDETVIIRVLEVNGESVRLGIDAPRSVTVLREEIWLATAANREAAGAPGPEALPDLPKKAGGAADALTASPPPPPPPKKSR